VNRSKSVKWL